MVNNCDDEDFCVARPIHNAKGKAFYQSAAGALRRWGSTTWIGNHIIYRAFDSLFKLHAQSISGVRVKGNFLQ